MLTQTQVIRSDGHRFDHPAASLDIPYGVCRRHSPRVSPPITPFMCLAETDSSQNQWIGPVYSLGQLTGGLVAAFFLDKLGRKPTLMAGAFLMILSTALLVWSGGFAVVIAARIIEGFSIGFLLLGYQVSYASHSPGLMVRS